ncbi:IS1182 family transposase [Syntrophobacter fumaroxidans]|nr:IS1182 family transposase [Syntrophobacter fumaroxidans]
MEKMFKSCDRKQLLLLPPSLLDWLPEGHLAHFILDVVEQLDLSELYASYKGDGRGQPPYEPGMMTALLFYAYCTGFPSSRQIEKRTHEDVAFRVIAANRHPDHDSI